MLLSIARRCSILVLVILFSIPVHCKDRAWIGLGSAYENLGSGIKEGGFSIIMEGGGYWNSSKSAFGGQLKGTFYNEVASIQNSKLSIIDLGLFYRLALEEGLYGKVLIGAVLIDLDGSVESLDTRNGAGVYTGLEGGFLFSVINKFELGPFIGLRRIFKGGGGSQLSFGVLGTYTGL